MTEVKKDIVIREENSVENLLAQAVAKGASVETMERLLAMRRELREEKAKELFDKSMSGFQGECPVIKKKKQGYNYKYAPLDDIVIQVKHLLSKYGFSYTFDTTDAENSIVIYCKVKHIAGHTETSQIKISKETTTKMNASQQSGAATTYGKRYAFCNAFGILTGDEDNNAQTVKSEAKTEVKAESDFSRVSRMIPQISNVEALKEMIKKVDGSKKYTTAEKYKLTKIIDTKIKSLETKE